jgi:hypothetical protein
MSRVYPTVELPSPHRATQGGGGRTLCGSVRSRKRVG